MGGLRRFQIEGQLILAYSIRILHRMHSYTAQVLLLRFNILFNWYMEFPFNNILWSHNSAKSTYWGPFFQNSVDVNMPQTSLLNLAFHWYSTKSFDKVIKVIIVLIVHRDKIAVKLVELWISSIQPKPKNIHDLRQLNFGFVNHDLKILRYLLWYLHWDLISMLFEWLKIIEPSVLTKTLTH